MNISAESKWYLNDFFVRTCAFHYTSKISWSKPIFNFWFSTYFPRELVWTVLVSGAQDRQLFPKHHKNPLLYADQVSRYNLHYLWTYLLEDMWSDFYTSFNFVWWIETNMRFTLVTTHSMIKIRNLSRQSQVFAIR